MNTNSLIIIIVTLTALLVLVTYMWRVPSAFMASMLVGSDDELFSSSSSSQDVHSSMCLAPHFDSEQSSYRASNYSLQCFGSDTNDFGWLRLQDNRVVPNMSAVSSTCSQLTPHKSTFTASLRCFLVPIERMDDFMSYLGDRVRICNLHMANDSCPVPSNFFIAQCWCGDQNLRRSTQAFATILPLEESKAAPQKSKSFFQGHVVLLGIDSMSHAAFHRFLPRSVEFFQRNLQGIEFSHFNIIGDGTTPNLMGLLTGHHEHQLPESRRGHDGAQFVDNFPWVWQNFSNFGFPTLWAEDGSAYGTFQYRLKGFERVPVDYYMRPFMLYVEQVLMAAPTQSPLGCLGNRPKHHVMFEWLEIFLRRHRSQNRSFSLVFYSELPHEDNAKSSAVDADVRQLLKVLHELENTVVVLFSDHGHRYSTSRASLRGKYEERLPFLSIALPPSLHQFREVLQANSNLLVTPFDIWRTLLHLLDSSSASAPTAGTFGLSLLKNLPRQRTCSDVGIAPHWCACLRWTDSRTANLPQDLARRAASQVLSTVNAFLAQQHLQDVCSPLVFRRILHSEHFQASPDVAHFRKNLDPDGRLPDMGDNMPSRSQFSVLRVTFTASASGTVTSPGALADATFEATVQLTQDEQRSFKIKDTLEHVSRVSSYREHAQCLLEGPERSTPWLMDARKFCICF